MQDVIQFAFDVDELADVVVVKLEPIQARQVLDVAQVAGDEVVHADDMVSFRDEAVTQMRSKEPRCTGDEDALHACQLEGLRPMET